MLGIGGPVPGDSCGEGNVVGIEAPAAVAVTGVGLGPEDVGLLLIGVFVHGIILLGNGDGV